MTLIDSGPASGSSSHTTVVVPECNAECNAVCDKTNYIHTILTLLKPNMMHGYQGDKEVAVAVFQDFSQI